MAMKFLRPSFFRELMSLIPSVAKEYQNQIEILPLDETNLDTFTCKVTPLRGPYQHASFIFRVGSHSFYPDRAPTVTCLTPIFHPNICNSSDSDNVCLNILSNWTRKYGLKELLHAILFLLYEPNPDEPINSDSLVPDGMTFNECVRLALRGEKVNNIRYRPNESWCKWASESGLLTDQVTPTEEVPSDKQQSDLNKRISLDHQLSADLFRPFVESEFHSITSLQTVSIRDSYSPDSGLWCWYVTLSPACADAKSTYLTRYYYVQSFDLQYSRSISIANRNMVLLPVHESDLPVSLQKAWMQYWKVEGDTGYQNRYLMYMTADDANSVLSEQTNSEVGSVHSRNHREQEQDELCDEWQDRIDPDQASEPEPGSQTNEHVEQQEEKNDEGIEETDEKEDNTDENIEDKEDGDKEGDEGNEEKEGDVEAAEDTAGQQNLITQYDGHDSDHESADEDLHDDSYDRYCCDDKAYWLNRYSLDEYRYFVRHLRPFWWWMYKTNWPQPFVPGRADVFERNCHSLTACLLLRAALGRLRADVNYLSKSYPPNSHVILVDPLTLSPFAPILNHLVRLPALDDSRAVIWYTMEWMSLSWALNPPSYSADSKHSAIRGSLPISCLCLLSNWLAYGSRLETYSCLGYSRRWSSLFFDSLGLVCLTPARLSPSGSCLLFDGWPLWLTVQLTRGLSSLLSGFLNRSVATNGKPIRTHFVFTDVDEI